MLNPTAELIHGQEPGSNQDAQNEMFSRMSVTQNDTLQTRKKSSPQMMKKSDSSPTPPRSKGNKSPKDSRRKLPSAPRRGSNDSKEKEMLSKSSDNLYSTKTTENDSVKNEGIFSKFMYNSLPRKKTSKGNRNPSSTFYVESNGNTSSPKSNRKFNTDNHSPSYSPITRRKNEKHEDVIDEERRQTHVALYKFVARHKDELMFSDGDPIQVLKMYDDLWYEGYNLLTKKQGVFPCRYVADIMAESINCDIGEDSDHRQFHMRFLGSVEVADYKGDEILCNAIAKVVNQRSLLSTSNPPECVIQVNAKGIRISEISYSSSSSQDSSKKNKKGKIMQRQESNEKKLTDPPESISHFFSLKNVTFCGNHPKDRRYFGFITKHPDEPRYASHIFMSSFSTDIVAKVIGDCFRKFYDTYMEYRAPTEDIYLDDSYKDM